MNRQLSKVYTENINAYSAELRKRKRKLTFISFVRLILFLLFVLFLYKSFTVQFTGYFIIYAILPLICFLLCLYWSAALNKKNRLLQQLIVINENEIHILNGRPNMLQNGSSFLPEKGFAVDLHVFGAHSLFHLLNRVGSASGVNQLSARLQNPFMQKEDIKNYQACIQELSGKLSFRQILLAHTLLLDEGETITGLQATIPADYFSLLNNRFWTILAFIWPITGMTILFLSIWKDNYRWLLLFGIFGLMILAFGIKKINLLYTHISKRSFLYNQYAICFQLILNEKFSHPYLLQKQKEIAYAGKSFHHLSKLTGLFDLRLSLLGFIINGLFLFDLLCGRAYLRWNAANQDEVKKWFDTMGEMELLNSLATFQCNHSNFIFPTCTEDEFSIHAKSMGHPLMNEANSIVNDFTIGKSDRLHIITGSNMSGKSTFLRTVGLNLILAQLGAPVFAKSFVFSPSRILTSFHHIDSLEESTSYFYAELKCLQGIIESLQQSIPSLVLLDEVMRGTNSTDKHDGTALLIQKIIHFPCISLIATHDIELGVLAQKHSGIIENYCFESELSDDGLIFDFTMRKGVAQTKNATYLMKKMGII